MVNAPVFPDWFNEATDEAVDALILGHDSNSYRNEPIDPVTWIEQNFYLYDTGNLITLHERQRRPLVEALRKVDGKFVYNTVLWSWPKKSAKSSVIAAAVEYVLANSPRSSAKLVANDLKQADSRVGHYLRSSIKFHADYKDTWRIKPSGYLIDAPNGSRCEMVPIDPNGEAGGNDDIIVYSELHGWKTAAHQKMWSEMTLSPNRYGKSQRWIDTYAGWVGESPILENLYDLGVNQGVQLWDGWEVYANEKAKLLCVWVTEWHLPWQTNDDGKAYYAEQESTLTVNEFNRMHRNQWVSSTESFVQPEWWMACKDDIPEFSADAPVVVGMDAGISNDCFALVGVSRVGEKVCVRFCRVWVPPRNGTVDFDEVEKYIREELTRLYNVVQIAYDNHQLHQMASALTRDGVAWMYKFSQQEPRLIADKLLYDMIRGRQIIHDGREELTSHVLNANAQTNKEDHNLRIVKRSDSLKIDACVSLSMATHEAKRLNIA